MTREAEINFLMSGDDAFATVKFPAIPNWSGGSLNADAYSFLQSYNAFSLLNDTLRQATTAPANTYSFMMPSSLIIDAATNPMSSSDQASFGIIDWRITARAQALMLTGDDGKPDANITQYILHRPQEKGDGRNQFVYDDHPVINAPQKFLAIPAMVTLFGPSYVDPNALIDTDAVRLARKNVVRLKTDIPLSNFVTAKPYTLDDFGDHAVVDEENLLEYSTLEPFTQFGSHKEKGRLLYQGMPDKNSDFGNRRVALEVFGWSTPDKKPGGSGAVSTQRKWWESMAAQIQTFFKPRDFTHPNQPAGNPTPNWLYYYQQAFPISEGIAYANLRTNPNMQIPLLSLRFTPVNDMFDAQTDYASIFYRSSTFSVRNEQAIKVPVYGLYDVTHDGIQYKQIARMGELRLSGLLGYIAVAGHEIGHNANARTLAFAGNPNINIELRQPFPEFDVDGDRVPDLWASQHYFVKQNEPNPYIESVPNDFSEVLAEFWALEYVNIAKEYWTKDWARDGLQWGEIPPTQEEPSRHPWEFIPYNAITRQWGASSNTTVVDVGFSPRMWNKGLSLPPDTASSEHPQHYIP